MRDRADPAESRFASLFAAIDAAGMRAETAIWHDDFADDVRQQLRHRIDRLAQLERELPQRLQSGSSVLRVGNWPA